MVSNEPNKVTFDSISRMLNIPKDISEVKFINEKLASILVIFLVYFRNSTRSKMIRLIVESLLLLL